MNSTLQIPITMMGNAIAANAVAWQLSVVVFPFRAVFMKTIALAILACLPVFAAGTVGVSINPLGPPTGPGGLPENRVHVITITWVGDSVTGSVPSTSVNVSQFPQLSGYRLVSIEIQPGSPSPSPSYSITITDASGIDLLAGNGASLSATTASYVGSLLSPPLITSPTFALTGNSVASAKGSISLYFAPLSQVAAARGLPATLPGNNPHTGTNTFSGPFAVNATKTGPAPAAVNGDITAAETATLGVIWLGADGNSSLVRSGTGLNLNSPAAGGTVISSSNLTVPTNLTIGLPTGSVISQTCSTTQKIETGADANLLTCAIPAVAASYRVRFILSVGASNAATLGWTATWTDSNGNAQAPTNIPELAAATAGSATSTLTQGFSGITGLLYGYADLDVNNSGTSIVVKLTFTGTSFTGKASASVERII